MAIERISILGVGLMGGSVGMACRQKLADTHVLGFSHKPDEIRLAVERGAIHEGSSDPAGAVENADLVILCTPVGSFEQMLKAIARSLRDGAIVTDVGSTKRAIVKLAAEVLPPQARFVGSHPMVGGEKQGVQNARADLLAGSLCIITPTASTDPKALTAVEQFWQSLGMRTTQMSPDRHDQLASDISHLPHAVAAALVRMQSSDSLAIAARGFLDTTRIAASDSALWRDILLENRDNVKAGILRLQDQLQMLAASLEAGDAEAVLNWLRVSAQVRGEMKPGK